MKKVLFLILVLSLVVSFAQSPSPAVLSNLDENANGTMYRFYGVMTDAASYTDTFSLAAVDDIVAFADSTGAEHVPSVPYSAEITEPDDDTDSISCNIDVEGSFNKDDWEKILDLETSITDTTRVYGSADVFGTNAYRYPYYRLKFDGTDNGANNYIDVRLYFYW